LVGSLPLSIPVQSGVLVKLDVGNFFFINFSRIDAKAAKRFVKKKKIMV